MKLRNILSIALVTFAVMSCSSESDILNDIPSQNIPTASVSEVSYVGVDVKSTNVQTKADKSAEQTITNAVFFLLDGENVIGYADKMDAKIFTKTRSDLQVYVIANLTSATIANLSVLKTLTAIQDVIFSAEDLKLMPKVGSANVTFNNGSSSTTEVPTCTVEVKVAQRNACIRLASCEVTGFSEGKAIDNVVLTKVAIANVKTQGYVGKDADVEGTFGNDFKTVSYNLWNKDGKVTGSFKAVDFLSFRNTSETKTAMTLTFTVDGVEKQLTFDIQAKNEAKKIENGYLYNVNVTVAVKGNTIEPTITLTVNDWNESYISGDMEDITK